MRSGPRSWSSDGEGTFGRAAIRMRLVAGSMRPRCLTLLSLWTSLGILWTVVHHLAGIIPVGKMPLYY